METAEKPRPLLEAHDLTKDFGNKKGIFGVSFALNPGQIIGFVGPNGAGKSTTINTITGLIKPVKGTLQLFGTPYTYQTVYKLMPRIGILYSEPNLEESLTGRQIFLQSAEILQKDCTKQWKSMSKALELDIDKPVRKLSLGNKKKVGVVLALMHEPDLIIMDEPTSGLDPVIRERFLDFIRTAAQRGAGVLLSSHDLGEVQEISDTILMIKAGHIIMTNSTDAILNQAQRLFRLIRPPESLVAKLKKSGIAAEIHHGQQETTFQTKDYEDTTRLLATAGFYDYFIERPSLEDTFKEYYD